jgi:hypothetical protein
MCGVTPPPDLVDTKDSQNRTEPGYQLYQRIA